MRSPIYEVVVGESLPDLSLWVTVDRQLVTDLASNATFELLVRNPDDNAVIFVKFDGFLGQTGNGNETDGVPNLVIRWANSGELDQLTPNRSHKALLAITRSSDAKVRYYDFVIKAIARTGA